MHIIYRFILNNLIFIITLSNLYVPKAFSAELSQELQTWAQQNPVIKVGVDSTFPPFDYLDKNNQPAGIGEVVRNQLSDILPINLQVTSTTEFDNEYQSLLKGSIDAISICGISEERKADVLFTKPLLTMAPILIVNKSKGDIVTDVDINPEHKIAVIKGYVESTYARELLGDDSYIEVSSNEKGYQAVESGEVDGFITYLYVYKYLNQVHHYQNLRPVSLSQFSGLKIAFCVNKNKPELVQILNFGIEQLGSSFALTVQKLWPSLIEELGLKEQKELSTNHHFFMYTVLICFAFLALIIIAAKRFDDVIAIKFNTLKFRTFYFIGLILVLAIIFVSMQLDLHSFKKQIIKDQEESFKITSEVTSANLEGWFKPYKALTTEIAELNSFKALVEQLLIARKKNDSRAIAKLKSDIHHFFDDRPSTTLNGRAYTLSDTSGEYLINKVRHAEGKIGAIYRFRPELFNNVTLGDTEFIPPVWSDVDLDGNTSDADKDPEIFIATPVKNDFGEVIAVFAMRFDPTRGQYGSLFNDVRLGDTFETYAVDKNGYLASESRFTSKLQQQGRLSIGHSAILTLQLPQPDKNPIVQAAQFKLDGQNLEGYLNYKGELVSGQWLWLEDYNFVVVSEVALDEKFLDYYKLQRLLYILFFITATLSLALSIFMMTISKRAYELNRDAKKGLEKQVDERTKELAMSERKNQLIFQSVADGIIGLTTHGEFVFVNDSASKILGYSEAEMLGNNIVTLLDNGRGIVWQDTRIYQTIKNNETIRVEQEQVFKKDGSSIDVEFSVSAVENDESNLAAVIALRDITQRVIETEQIKKILDNTPICMVMMSKNDTVEMVNKAGVELLGFTAEEIIGQPVGLFIPDDQIDSHKALLAKFFQDREVIDTNDLDRVFRIKHSSGKLIEIQAVYTPVSLYSGDVAVVTVRDISVEKETERKLIEAKQISDDASKAKSDFLANMSHEIRTPMNAIMGMSHLALSCDLERKPHNYITKVSKAAESLLGIINDILDFSKIEAGKLDLESIDFNLHDAFDNLSNIIGIKSYEKKLELLFDIHADVPVMLIGDSLRLNQILVNIAGNAVKFTEQGEIVISAKVKELAQDKVLLEFSVKDSGIGMTDEQKSKLFKSFSQADSSITRKYGGTGLGLTISKKLVELMQGDIWLASEKGQGSTFSFTAEFGISNQQAGTRIHHDANYFANKRVMIVDDNPLAIDVLSSMITSFGCKVIRASSGEEALTLVRQSTLGFDFFLVDWKMPGLDGLETCEELSQQFGYDHKHFILVTSHAGEDVILDKLKGHIDSVITKPITASTLLDAMMIVQGHEVVKATRQVTRDNTLLENQQKLVGCHLLLVEDNELNQELALELLNQAGVITDLAENGQEAVEKVAKNSYNGVLMDLQMPVMDGFTATQLILQAQPDLPIIAMTANAMAGDKEKVLNAGMCDHITKPINVSEMFSTLALWFADCQRSALTNEVNAPRTVASDTKDNEQEQLALIEHLTRHFTLLDIKAGLAVSNGNTRLFVKLLAKFIKGQADFSNNYHQALEQGKLDDVIRFAHTLKGSAGNIGAKALHAQASQLEQGLINQLDEAQLSHFFAETNQALAKLLSQLNLYFDEQTGQEKVNNVTAFTFDEAMIDKLKLLSHLIDDYETDALDLADEIIEQLSGTKEAATFERVYRHVEAYEFSEAEVELNRFMADIEVKE